MGSLQLSYSAPVDLRRTMDIQIPALLWVPDEHGFHRTYYRRGAPIDVSVRQRGNQAVFHWVSASNECDGELARILERQFPLTIGDLDVGSHPVWLTLQERYRGVLLMQMPPFEALVVTILSQIKTADAVRTASVQLHSALRGIAPAALVNVPKQRLRQLIRSAGPWKADYLISSAGMVLASGVGSFNAAVELSTPDALAFLERFHGVGPKTAACVLAFSVQNREAVPVDTHLFRIAGRLGLVRHQGKLNPTTIRRIVSVLSEAAPDAGLAHLVFPLLGRELCRARRPKCYACPLRLLCPACAHDSG